MAKYRKKPVVIEAIQFTGNNDIDIWVWMESKCEGLGARDGRLVIHTLEGTMVAQPGDWIIRGVKGKFYPCKPDIFETTYEPA